ncbi:MAG TPA: hypothetical protein VGO62_13575 [Myxococcota bacterium]
MLVLLLALAADPVAPPAPQEAPVEDAPTAAEPATPPAPAKKIDTARATAPTTDDATVELDLTSTVPFTGYGDALAPSLGVRALIGGPPLFGPSFAHFYVGGEVAVGPEGTAAVVLDQDGRVPLFTDNAFRAALAMRASFDLFDGRDLCLGVVFDGGLGVDAIDDGANTLIDPELSLAASVRLDGPFLGMRPGVYVGYQEITIVGRPEGVVTADDAIVGVSVRF